MADITSLFEPRRTTTTPVFIQVYAGAFLRPQEVHEASQKRSHTFSFRTSAHDVYQGLQECIPQTQTDPVAKVAKKKVVKNARLYQTAPGKPQSTPSSSTHQLKGDAIKLDDCIEFKAQPTNTTQKQLERGCCQRKPHDVKFEGSCRQDNAKATQQTVAVAAKDSREQVSIEEDVGCTLVLRNIPRALTQAELLKCLMKLGFGDEVVLLYVPCFMRDLRQGNIGYGFVHLQTKAGKEALNDAWHGKFPFGRQAGLKPLNIACAAVQGAKENVEAWNNSRKMGRIRNPDFRPILLKDVAGLPKAHRGVWPMNGRPL